MINENTNRLITIVVFKKIGYAMHKIHKNIPNKIPITDNI